VHVQGLVLLALAWGRGPQREELRHQIGLVVAQTAMIKVFAQGLQAAIEAHGATLLRSYGAPLAFTLPVVGPDKRPLDNSWIIWRWGDRPPPNTYPAIGAGMVEILQNPVKWSLLPDAGLYSGREICFAVQEPWRYGPRPFRHLGRSANDPWVMSWDDGNITIDAYNLPWPPALLALRELPAELPEGLS
jgi:hypothetical protein